MKIRTRLFLVFFILVGLGFYQLVNVIVSGLRPRYLATMEESMVETATMLSALVASQLGESGDLPTADLAAMLALADHWNVVARIYEIDKTRLNVRVYVTDAAGIVVYDSDGGRDVGADYSQWNDVYLTLKGRYGARATRAVLDDPTSSILHVAAPIMQGERIAGVLAVAKPAGSVEPFRETARRRIIRYGILMGVLVIVLGMGISLWITSPIEKLTAYANAIRDGKRPAPPPIGRSEVGRLAESFEQMRDALEGKQYVERYVETLTHEMKSPLSVIRGAAELMEEEMPVEQRLRFIRNIRSETERIQTLIDRLLLLSALERRKGLQDAEPIDMPALVNDVVDGMAPQVEARHLDISSTLDDVPPVKGERFLLRQAIANLLQNAIDFTPPNGHIRVTLALDNSAVRLTIHNSGPGIPDFATDRIFERFYSLARTDTGRKSSGIGLTLVKEVADLHSGTISITNSTEGVTATFTLAPPS
ncbi:MAG: two-component system sensor histidine kinase CreC [Verrucomicrobia bacterium]|nr:two-component system sensor histidine kinase CreC [Verrucomicrobiota bacterium]MBT7700696.1 two-component system sensor histidine kinase CreC [Verrucomicrobiota bacterium]